MILDLKVCVGMCGISGVGVGGKIMNPEGTRKFSSPYATVLLIVSGKKFPAKGNQCA